MSEAIAPAIVTCSCCGATGEAIEDRSRRTGALIWAYLPVGWKTGRVSDDEVHHFCGPCASLHVEGSKL